MSWLQEDDALNLVVYSHPLSGGFIYSGTRRGAGKQGGLERRRLAESVCCMTTHNGVGTKVASHGHPAPSPGRSVVRITQKARSS